MKAMLRVSTSDDLPRVLGDEARTHQVLANLIDNAVKYSPAGSRVDVEVQRENGNIRFSVRETSLDEVFMSLTGHRAQASENEVAHV